MRRKIMRIAYVDGKGSCSAEERKTYKEKCGRPTRLLNKTERRLWAKLFRYGRQTGKDMSAEFAQLCLG